MRWCVITTENGLEVSALLSEKSIKDMYALGVKIRFKK